MTTWYSKLARPSSSQLFPPTTFATLDINLNIMNNTLLQRTVERIENSDSQGNTSTEDLVVINTLAASLDATEMARMIRIPQARSFFDESFSDDISERLIRPPHHDFRTIDETLEALLENTFSEEREDNSSFLDDITAQSWKIHVTSTNMDEVNISSVLNTLSFNELVRSPKLKVKTRGTFDSLREEVYFEQPVTLVTLNKSDMFLYDIFSDTEEKISFSSMGLTAACVLPDNQIVATGSCTQAYIYHTNGGWKRIGDLIFSRKNHSMVFHKGTVFIIGGNERREVERLENNTVWEEIMPLNNARSFPAAVSMQGKLYVIGGVRENWNWAAIEVLNEMVWEVLEVKLPCLRGHACFFTPEHEIVILGNSVMITIDKSQTISKIIACGCQDYFLMNSWSYLEEENKVMVWGQMMIWKYDIGNGNLEAFKRCYID
jgi:hypothetical protein